MTLCSYRKKRNSFSIWIIILVVIWCTAWTLMRLEFLTFYRKRMKIMAKCPDCVVLIRIIIKKKKNRKRMKNLTISAISNHVIVCVRVKWLSIFYRNRMKNHTISAICNRVIVCVHVKWLSIFYDVLTSWRSDVLTFCFIILIFLYR